MICPLSPVSMIIFPSGPSWLWHTQTFQLAPLLYISFHLWCSHFHSTLQTFSCSTLFSSTLRMMLTTGQGWQSMLGTPKSLSLLAPQTSNWSFGALWNSFCAFTSHTLSLPHYGSDFCWFGPRSYLLPQAAQNFPIISPRLHSHFFNLAPVAGDCAHRGCQLPSGCFY